MIRSQGRKAVQDVHNGLKGWSQRSSLEPLLYRFISTDQSSERRQKPPQLTRRSSANGEAYEGKDSRAPGARFPPPLRSRAPFSKEKKPTGADGETTQKLLKPYDLGQQLKRLCAEGNISGAVERLQSTPRDAQNTQVWNTMLSLCLSHHRYQLAYTLFTDMKRRGFPPNSVTYLTMLKGLSHVVDWSQHPQQLENAHKLYEYYQKHVESIKYHEPDNLAELTTAPLVAYITILGAANQHQKMFDVYFALDQEGPGAPDKFVYTAMLRAIANHHDAKGKMSVRDTAASDAKHVWLQVEKAMQKRPDFELDSRLIAAAISALTRGRPNDQNLALDITVEHLGLTKAGDSGPSKLSKHLNTWTLDAALHLCIVMQKHRLCVHFMHQVMDRIKFADSRFHSLVTRTHIHKLIRAHSALASLASPDESSRAMEALEWCLNNDAVHHIPALRPNEQTYHLVLMTCYRNSDWEGALKTFQLMTGIQVDSFHASEGKSPPEVQKRPKGRNLEPDVETMAFITRTALATKEHTNCLQAMWLAEFVDVSKMLQNKDADPYYRGTLARTLSSMIRHLLGDPRTESMHTRLSLLRAQAQEVARRIKGPAQPNWEKMPFGTMSKLAQEDEAVAFDLAARSTKPRKL
ncbi:hypothetical protein HYDPIDRAFT_78511 [Hydnomerulius pinastri MD-312]|nr:hypothetical protein HYDPIDRAFT_78511 [Hydnomerulius pinastri MD-312]